MSGRAQAPGGKSWANRIVGNWVDQAACEGCDSEVFFPPEQHGRRRGSVLAGDASLAKLICAGGMVQVDCLHQCILGGLAVLVVLTVRAATLDHPRDSV